VSVPNQYTSRVPKTVLRQLQKAALGLQDVEEKAHEDILVFIHEGKEKGLSNAAIAGMFGVSPSGIPAKAAQGADLKAQRARRKGASPTDA
jgi:hypothetical protein